MVHIGKLTDGNGTWGLIDKIEGRCGGPTVYFYGFHHGGVASQATGEANQHHEAYDLGRVVYRRQPLS